MNFWKMHGLGNDYVVIDNRDDKVEDKDAPALAKKLCGRRFSIGADGLLMVYNSTLADVRMRIFNADGSEAEMCGNGIRCFSKFCYENGIVVKDIFDVETNAGKRHVWLQLSGKTVYSVKVDMGAPSWDRKSLPMKGEGECINDDLQVDEDETYKVTCLSMGNPHCIIFVENIDDSPIEYIGPLIENNPAFPNRTNVGFVQVVSKNEIRVRIWERGCGETLACGTGTCAAVAAASRLGKVKDKVTVHVLGGDLLVEVGKTILLTGAAEKVFEGKLP
jgi:diaminopimelate epimerase